MKLLSASLQISCFVLQISDPLSLPFLRSETVISVSLLFCSLSLSLCLWIVVGHDLNPSLIYLLFCFGIFLIILVLWGSKIGERAWLNVPYFHCYSTSAFYQHDKVGATIHLDNILSCFFCWNHAVLVTFGFTNIKVRSEENYYYQK